MTAPATRYPRMIGCRVQCATRPKTVAARIATPMSRRRSCASDEARTEKSNKPDKRADVMAAELNNPRADVYGLTPSLRYSGERVGEKGSREAMSRSK